jgi:hypothetical protein
MRICMRGCIIRYFPHTSAARRPSPLSTARSSSARCGRRRVDPEVGPTPAFYRCIPTGMHGPTRIVRANLTPFFKFSLGQAVRRRAVLRLRRRLPGPPPPLVPPRCRPAAAVYICTHQQDIIVPIRPYSCDPSCCRHAPLYTLWRTRARVISDCHFAVQLNRFMPGFLSCLVAVFRK